MLTTEFLDGLPPGPAADLRRAGIDPEAVLRAGAAAMLRQIFQFGLFHADPHPGNVLFLQGDRVGFVDFGMFGRLDLSERRRMAFVFWALADGDYEAVGDHLLRLSEFLPGADPAGFRAALADTVEEWFGVDAAEFSIARLLLSELALGARHGIVFPRGLMLLGRALVNLEATAMIVDPQLNLAELARPLLPELRHILQPGPEALQEHWHRYRFEYLDLAADLPALLPEAIARLRAQPALSPPPAAQPASRRWLPLAGAFAAGAGLAALARKRRRVAPTAPQSQTSPLNGIRVMIGATEPSSPAAWPVFVRYPGIFGGLGSVRLLLARQGCCRVVNYLHSRPQTVGNFAGRPAGCLALSAALRETLVPGVVGQAIKPGPSRRPTGGRAAAIVMRGEYRRCGAGWRPARARRASGSGMPGI